MSGLNRFLKQNKTQRENVTYAATRSLTEEDGSPLLWTIKPLTTRENDIIRDDCTVDVQVPGKPNLYRPKLDTTKYLNKMLVASVVEPNLYNRELQESYGVAKPEDLLKEMIDNAGEYQDFAAFVQRFNGFDSTFNDKVEEAKN